MLTAPSLAGAAPLTRLYETSFGAFQKPQSIAVDQSNGDVYVLDAGARTVSRFDSSLKPKSFSKLNTNVIDGSSPTGGLCGVNPSPNCDQTPANDFSFDSPTAAQVAIDNSGSPLTNGNIYVTDSFARVVDIFASTGAYIGQLTRSGDLGPTFGVPCGVTVDASGAVYVGDRLQAKVHKFVPSASPPVNADFVADFTATSPCVLAAGIGPTAGALFINRKNGVASKLDSAGTLQYQLSTATGRGVAVDPATGHALLALESEVVEYDASGATSATTIASFGSTQLNTSGGVAADGPRAKVYVSDTTTGRVNVYGQLTPPLVPTVSLGPLTPLSGGREGLSAYIDANGTPTTYYLEYGEDDCAVNTCASVPATEDAAVGKSTGVARVSQVLSGLRPGTTYHYRFVATNAAGTTAGESRTFTTLEMPTTSACANQSIRSAQALSLRFPDCRAYEWVSAFAPAERNEADVLLSSERVRAAMSGDGFKFASVRGAGDVQGLSASTDYIGVRDPRTGWDAHGISPRQPSVPIFGIALNDREPRYVGEFTPDLSKGVFFSISPLNEEGPNVRGIWNLYRREDLRAPGPGSYRLLSDSATAQSPFSGGQSNGEDSETPHIAGASTDLSHVVFESPRSLTLDAAGLPAGPRLYKSVDGQVRLVGVLPSFEGGGPSVSQAGQGYRGAEAPRSVSVDGSRVVFTAPPFNLSESIGGTTYVEVGGRLYMRDDHGTPDPGDDTTVKINASEKTNGGGPGGVDPNGAQPATFWGASAQLSKIVFTTTEALTDDAPSGEPTVKKLYLYDLDASGDHLTLLSADHNPADGISNQAEGAIAVSDDGSYVYFLGTNQLVADRPLANTPRIFVWHDGEVRQVAAVNAGIETARLLGGAWTEASVEKRGGKWARSSANGRHLVFVTEGTSDLAGYDHGTTCPAYTSSQCTQVYKYSAGPEEQLQCVSCPRGGKAIGDADFNIPKPAGLAQGSRYLNRALSSDARFAFFTSGEQLVDGDENDSPDVYEFDASTGLVHLLSGGRPNVASRFLDSSADGSDVFFATAANLLGADGNQNVDVYDARVGGGFEEPVSPPVVPCASTESCRPPTSVAQPEPAAQGFVPPPSATPRKARHKKRHKHRGKAHKQRSRGHKQRSGGRRGGGHRG